MRSKKRSLFIMLSLFGATLFTVPFSFSIYISVPSDIEIDINVSSEEQHIYRIYFQDATWWKSDGASTAIHMWNSTTGATTDFPGVKMNKLEYNSAGDYNIWYYDFDSSIYDSFLFIRVDGNYANDGNDAADWNARTSDISFDKDINYYIIGSKCWFNGSYPASYTATTYPQN